MAVDEQLACYGAETNTGVKLVAVVDMAGRTLSEQEAEVKVRKGSAGNGLRHADLKPVSWKVQRDEKVGEKRGRRPG
jgi:hypothetical protein